MRYNITALDNHVEFELPDDINWHTPDILTGYNNIVSIVDKEYNNIIDSPVISKYYLNDKLLLMIRGLSDKSLNNIPVSSNDIDEELNTSNHIVIRRYSSSSIEISRLVKINTGSLIGTLIRNYIHLSASGFYHMMNNCSFDVVFNKDGHIELMDNKLAMYLWYYVINLSGSSEFNKLMEFDRLFNIVKGIYS